MKSIGERLREARQARGLSQNKLSRLSGVSLSTINQLEKGIRGQRTGTDIVTKLVTILSVHRAWLEAGLGPRDTEAAAEPIDRYPNRQLATRAARDLAMNEEAIARVESMVPLANDDDDPEPEWWMGQIVDAGRSLRDPLIHGRKAAADDFGDEEIDVLRTLMKKIARKA